jgi:ribosomal protein S18 acetylase RimI-like enzyme
MSNRTDTARLVQVRPHHVDDLAAIAELLGQLGYPSTLEQVRQRMAALAAEGTNHLLVAELEGTVVGLAAVRVGQYLEKDSRHGQLIGIVTDDRARRRGVARALLRAVEELARREGCDLLFLRSSKRRTDAPGFYRAEGYEETHLTLNKTLSRGPSPPARA